MFSIKHFNLEKTLLLSLSFSILMVSCVCWGRIISEHFSARETLVERPLAPQVEAARQVKDHAVLFSGVMIVILRHLPLGSDD
ncbi:hypothetical protein C900_05323 [Fulvivirga imtechensis AK7]|uniref:Uncharacterized protein n=1 Tax=Fulvivirga imtechensis AK7 TaxID=1237149 RepID=L8JPH5_9BACT|nr:hypothetical protein [Fulvivirga imtechensis]ELR69252.1 hypothetical protein C900_05323 [Fulvivirga imtechensis AK7]